MMIRKLRTICILLVCFAGSSVSAEDVSLTIHPDRVLNRIDEKVYGHFLEHIYHSCNGGLWGELIWDRSFEGGGAGVAWSATDDFIAQEGAAADVRLTFGSPQWKDYEFTVEARKTDGEEGFLIPGRGQIVLVVEDEAAVRQAVVACLEALAYRPLEAANGQEALAIYEQERIRGQGVELVLSDLVMPEMGGEALLHALRERDPAVKLVVLTGHLMPHEMQRLESAGVAGCLHKPPDLAQLARVVDQALREVHLERSVDGGDGNEQVRTVDGLWGQADSVR